MGQARLSVVEEGKGLAFPAARRGQARRVAVLQSEVAHLRAERSELLADLAAARAWIKSLAAWIEEAGEPTVPVSTGVEIPDRRPDDPFPWRRAAALAGLVLTPWAVAAGVAAAVWAGLT